MPYTVKLRRGDVTRRIPFPVRPRWVDLAAKIQQLFSISVDFAGVSYLDADGDEVTLSSQDEIEDYYASFPNADTFKFTAIDLTVSRQEDRPIPGTPTSRNTFGGPNILYEVDQDWQIPIGEPYGRFGREDSLHAYVETIESSSSLSRAQEDERTAPFKGQEKAKTRDTRSSTSTVSDGVSSTASVIDSDAPSKPPVHVAIHGLHHMPSDTFGHRPAVSTPAHDFSPSASSTPCGTSTSARTATLSPLIQTPPAPEPSISSAQVPDPPSPEIHPETFATPTVSFVDDVAALLESFGIVLQSHPELTGSLRTILNNIQNGTYWSAHRDGLSRAAEDIRRVSLLASSAVDASMQDMQRATEEEAKRRIADGLENLFRPFTGVVGSTTAASVPTAASAPAAPGPNAAPAVPDLVSMMTPPQPSAPPPRTPAGTNIPMGHSLPTSQPALVVPPWSVFKPYVPAQTGQPRASVPAINTQNIASRPPDVSFYSATPVSPSSGRERPRASDLKASLEAAKENYKREKERYRREREERRRLRLARDTNEIRAGGDTAPRDNAAPVAQVAPVPPATDVPVVPVTPPRPPRQVISNARGGFPQMEIVELPSPKKSPKRQHANSGAGATITAIPMSQAMRNVVEKLGNVSLGIFTGTRRSTDPALQMGFSEDSYPFLNSAIDAHLPLQSEITKEKENDVVNEVVEDLLASEPAAHVPGSLRASGSGTRQPEFWL
ncbi:hypothetical protein K488DRAFT_86848 [Vararia minispora EC-137]|uniref:Uncharacterized protein n=1 Tax=Vararia minispora EC-137 TaxID=1314806 RepID=A0ACB8QIG7_9AGAM|nr:hypothetical protein K488DRAFT_86848 [Vararia minispora EC-137]